MEIVDSAQHLTRELSGTRRARPVAGPGVVDVALAEFSALRSEIDNLASAHRTMINLNITVVAAITGLVLANRADPHLLLALPLVSGAIGLVYQWYVMHAKHIGDYIDETLRPLLVEQTGDDRMLAWEHRLRTEVYRRPGSAITSRIAYVLLFPAVPAASLVVTYQHLDSPWYWTTWLAGFGLLIVQVTVWWLQARRWVCWT